MDDLIFGEDQSLWLCQVKNPVDLAQKILKFYKNRTMQRIKTCIGINQLVALYLKEIEGK